MKDYARRHLVEFDEVRNAALDLRDQPAYFGSLSAPCAWPRRTALKSGLH